MAEPSKDVPVINSDINEPVPPPAVNTSPAESASSAPQLFKPRGTHVLWGNIFMLYSNWKLREKQKGGKGARCILCKKDYIYSDCTGNLEKHARLKHGDVLAAAAGGSTGPMDKHMQVGLGLADDIAKWVALTFQPLSVTTPQSFRDIFLNISSNLRVPDRAALTERIGELSQHARGEVLTMLRDEFVAFTSDIWTSAAVEAFISLTAHFINDKWELVDLPLECAEFGGSHTGPRIAEKTKAMIERNGILLENVSAIVIDNGANMKAAFKTGPLDSNPCVPHTLQLTVKELCNQADVEAALQVARQVVGAFKHSAKKTEELKSLQIALGLAVSKLVQDVKTRWSSSLLMIIKLLQNKAAVSAVCLKYPEKPQTNTSKKPKKSRSEQAVQQNRSTDAALPTAGANLKSSAAAASDSDDSSSSGNSGASNYNSSSDTGSVDLCNPITGVIEAGAQTRLRSGTAVATPNYAEEDIVDVEDSGSDADNETTTSIAATAERTAAATGKRAAGKSKASKQPAKKPAKKLKQSAPPLFRDISKLPSARGRGRGRGRGGRGQGRGGAAAVTVQPKVAVAKPMARLTDAQWTVLQLVHDLLKPFHDVQTAQEGQKYVSNSMTALYIKQLREHLDKSCESTNTAIAAAAKLMRTDFTARWAELPKAVFIASAMDVRTKKMSFFDAVEKGEAWEYVRDEMIAIYKLVLEDVAAGISVSNSSGTSTPANTAAGAEEPQADSTAPLSSTKSALQSLLDDDSDHESDTDASATNAVLSEQMLRERCDAELGFYKQVTRLELGKNPLEWWKENAKYYPLLSPVARKWLAVPASSAASERLFSAAGLVVTSKRTRLKSEKVESLVFLKAAWPTLQKHGLMY